MNTGKTTYLARQVAEAVAARGSANVLVTSFTRAAAAELVSRDLPIDRDQIGTLHAHCYRALGKPTIAETRIEEWNKEVPGFALTDSKGKRDDYFGGDEPPGNKAFADYQLARAQMRPRELWTGMVTRFATRWERWKAENELVDFTDMIDLAYKYVDVAPGNPSVLFCDEGQDFSALELALVRKWGSHMDRFIIAGDDDQCLYDWSGATADAFLDPPVDAEHKRILSQSYRVPRAVHAMAQKWIERLERREPKEYKPRDAEGEVRHLPHLNWESPAPVLKAIEPYLADGKSVMLLTTCSYMLKPLIAELRAAGIPYHNPLRRARGDWNPLTPARGLAAKERLLAYLRPAESVWGDEARFWTGDDLRMWTSLLRKSTFEKGGAEVIEDLRAESEAPISELMAAFAPGQFGEAAALRLDWLRDHMTKAANDRMSFPLKVAERSGAAALRNVPQVLVGTGHSVKGGEADVVVMFPDISRQAAVARSLPGGKDALTRLAYVMMTRARESLLLCGPCGPFAINLPN